MTEPKRFFHFSSRTADAEQEPVHLELFSSGEAPSSGKPIAFLVITGPMGAHRFDMGRQGLRVLVAAGKRLLLDSTTPTNSATTYENIESEP